MFTAYIIPISRTKHALRASVYLLDPSTQELRLLWMSDTCKSEWFDITAKKAGFSVNVSDKSRPRIYLESAESVVSAEHDIAVKARAVMHFFGRVPAGEPVQFYMLEGFAPSYVATLS